VQKSRKRERDRGDAQRGSKPAKRGYGKNGDNSDVSKKSGGGEKKHNKNPLKQKKNQWTNKRSRKACGWQESGLTGPTNNHLGGR